MMLQSIVVGRVFHKTGAALLNARAPHRVAVLGSSTRWAPADLSERVGKNRCVLVGLQCTQAQVRLDDDID